MTWPSCVGRMRIAGQVAVTQQVGGTSHRGSALESGRRGTRARIALPSHSLLRRGRGMPEQSLSAGLVRFGVFELDRGSGELRKAGVRISLQEQALQVLTSLLERPGDLVTREELRQRLWPNGTFGDFDHGLNAVVNRLRDTLGDSADSPRFIETLPRRGYRFIAPIESDRIASPAVAP